MACQEAAQKRPASDHVAGGAGGARQQQQDTGLVLDPFGGSGTTVIACKKSGRRARLIEMDQVCGHHYSQVANSRNDLLDGRVLGPHEYRDDRK